MKSINETSAEIETLDDLATMADYSLMDTLSSDPEATADGIDHAPRQVFSGHFSSFHLSVGGMSKPCIV